MRNEIEGPKISVRSSVNVHCTPPPHAIIVIPPVDMTHGEGRERDAETKTKQHLLGRNQTRRETPLLHCAATRHGPLPKRKRERERFVSRPFKIQSLSPNSNEPQSADTGTQEVGPRSTARAHPPKGRYRTRHTAIIVHQPPNPPPFLNPRTPICPPQRTQTVQSQARPRQARHPGFPLNFKRMPTFCFSSPFPPSEK